MHRSSYLIFPLTCNYIISSYFNFSKQTTKIRAHTSPTHPLISHNTSTAAHRIVSHHSPCRAGAAALKSELISSLTRVGVSFSLQPPSLRSNQIKLCAYGVGMGRVHSHNNMKFGLNLHMTIWACFFLFLFFSFFGIVTFSFLIIFFTFYR